MWYFYSHILQVGLGWLGRIILQGSFAGQMSSTGIVHTQLLQLQTSILKLLHVENIFPVEAFFELFSI